MPAVSCRGSRTRCLDTATTVEHDDQCLAVGATCRIGLQGDLTRVDKRSVFNYRHGEHVRSRALALGAAAILFTTLIPAHAGAAALSIGRVHLPDIRFHDVVLNDATRHVYVTSGATATAVHVYTYAGEGVATIPGQSGASGMVLNAEKTRLYVALHEAAAVSEIDTATLTETRRWATGDARRPLNLALTADRLWIGTASDALLSLDPADPSSPVRFDATLPDEPLLGAAANMLAVASASGNDLRVLDVTGGTVQASRRSIAAGGAANDVAVSADGSTVLIAVDRALSVGAFSTSDFSPVSSYDTPSGARAVAISGDGHSVITGSDYQNTAYEPYSLRI